MIEIDYEPLSQARKLTALWHERWGSCERLSDVPLDIRLLLPWVDDLAIFELVDHGADFRLRAIGGNLTALFGCEGGQPSLSDFPLPYRQTLRQVLLRAAMTSAPATEHYDWLVGGRVRSCIVCAMPIAGGFYQPSQLLLGVFPRLSTGGQRVTSRVDGTVGRSPRTDAPTALAAVFPEASPTSSSRSRRSTLAADSRRDPPPLPAVLGVGNKSNEAKSSITAFK